MHFYIAFIVFPFHFELLTLVKLMWDDLEQRDERKESLVSCFKSEFLRGIIAVT